MSKLYARLADTASFLPERVLDNHFFSERLDTSHAWIHARTGIEQRHVVGDDESVVDLAWGAVRGWANKGQLDDVDLTIVATMTPERFMPSTACLLQQRLGLQGPAFDINAACSGFVYALVTAEQYITNGMARRVLVVGVDAMTRMLNWDDRSTCVLFGDGAGAVILEASDQPGILGSCLHAQGEHADLLRTVPQTTDAARSHVQMQGREVFKHAVKSLEALVSRVLEKADLTRDDLDWLIPHQANVRIIEATARFLKLPMEQVILTVNQHANTSAASIPLALDYAIKAQRIQRGETLLLEAFGAGLTEGAVVLKY